jgi:hypothetical protein
MSNTGSDADDFMTETKCSNQSINISLLMQLEDGALRSSSGEKMFGVLPWKNCWSSNTNPTSTHAQYSHY